jgi:hypothetical protein
MRPTHSEAFTVLSHIFKFGLVFESKGARSLAMGFNPKRLAVQIP